MRVGVLEREIEVSMWSYRNENFVRGLTFHHIYAADIETSELTRNSVVGVINFGDRFAVHCIAACGGSCIPDKFRGERSFDQ